MWRRALEWESVVVVTEEDDIQPTISRLLKEDGPHVVVIKCEPGMPDGIGVIPIDGMGVRNRFMDAAKPGV